MGFPGVYPLLFLVFLQKVWSGLHLGLLAVAMMLSAGVYLFSWSSLPIWVLHILPFSLWSVCRGGPQCQLQF
jgi:hypothetical protein